MMDNIDIFITCFKPHREYVTDNRYKMLCVKDFNYNGKLESFKDNVGDNISHMNDFFSELTGFYWLAKNYEIKDYIGICSYRRFFDFFDNIDSIETKLLENDIILPKKEFVGNVFNHYGLYHNIEDLKLVLELLCKRYPQYISSAEKVMNQNSLYCNNMFIMKKEDYYKYCEFVFNVLFDYLNVKGFNNMEDIFNYVKANKHLYLKNDILYNSVTYQSRIGGFLAERIFNIYIDYNFNKICEIPMIFTSDNPKYEDKNETTIYFGDNDLKINA